MMTSARTTEVMLAEIARIERELGTTRRRALGRGEASALAMAAMNNLLDRHVRLLRELDSLRTKAGASCPR